MRSDGFLPRTVNIRNMPDRAMGQRGWFGALTGYFIENMLRNAGGHY